VVLAITAVLAGLAAPSFTAFFDRFRVETARKALVQSIQVARTEAIRQRQQVVIAQNVCASNNWSCGWTMCVDTNANNACDAAELVLRVTEAPRSVAIVKGTPALPVVINRFGQIPVGGNVAFNFGPRGNASSDDCQSMVMNVAMRLTYATGTAQCPPLGS